MKTLVLTALLFLGYHGEAQKSNTMKTQNEDSRKISEILEKDYFEGIYTGDVARLKKIYYPGTLLFGDVKGQPYAKTLPEYLDGMAHRQSPKDSGKPFKGQVLDIKVTNSIAIAEVKVKMYDFDYHEYLSFHKLDGKWLLVNKMISDVAESKTNVVAEKKSNLIATLEVLPGFESEVKKAMSKLAAETQKEADNELFIVSTRNESPLTIVVYEIYKSDAAFEYHKTTPHAQAFFEFVKGKIKDDNIDLDFLTLSPQ
ncbi:nuclear transport factor 2 family protein [Flavobacterium sp. MAH-1]|uniref:Nuclear transport factor 2 family protein n=1 Tax=Flavobacterium agri TaxID=2743471 RepID=A0A7Y9C510_9FLAO|nr:nuclear transport factor 2 family protein [Flavobacterium agri]NUY80445.1 nuclear transport factor 2 family protein [Flavobacterium agri]NYA70470.1 nuclear transport factor 2 family protein [Flavobacterium agri]